MILVAIDDKGHKRCLQSHILSGEPPVTTSAVPAEPGGARWVIPFKFLGLIKAKHYYLNDLSSSIGPSKFFDLPAWLRPISLSFGNGDCHLNREIPLSFEQLEHYLGGILWGAKNDQVGVIFSVILLVLEISITASPSLKLNLWTSILEKISPLAFFHVIESLFQPFQIIPFTVKPRVLTRPL